MSLSTHVKRISPNQWRYYYNQLLFVDAPLSAYFMQELMPPKGNSPTVEIKPITATEDISEGAYGSYSELVLLETPTFQALATQLPCHASNQRLIVNIYLDAVLNRGSDSAPVTVGKWTDPAAIASMRSPLSPTVELTHSSEPPAVTIIGAFSAPLLPVRPKAEIPEPLCQVSALLAGFMTR